MQDSQDLAKMHAEDAEDIAKHVEDVRGRCQTSLGAAKQAQELPSKPTHLRFPHIYIYNINKQYKQKEYKK